MDEIKLVLDGEEVVEKELTPAPEEAAIAGNYLDGSNLNDEEKNAVVEFSQKIDIKDSNVIMQYGAACEKKISEFSDSVMENVRTKDLGEATNMLTDLVVQLKGFELEPKKKGLAGLFSKGQTSIEKIKAQYLSTEQNIDSVETALTNHQNQLSKDVVMLDKMYEANLHYFKELTMYILAGKQKLEEEKNTTLAELVAKAKETGLAEDAQAVNDFNALINRFEKKIYDLELTRNISIQMAPQIRLIQNNNLLMVERIQSTLNNTLPLWKNQIVLALGMAHSKEATEAQRQVNDFTNDLLKKNAETLKQNTIEVARESERAVVDIETLKETNQKLIETFDEVLKIQAEGKEKRAQAESELGRIENDLKNKLLEIKTSQVPQE